MTIHRRGFAALMSVIVISALLTATVLVSVSRGRSALTDSLEAEYKIRSQILAEACAERALLDIAMGDIRAGTISVDAAVEPPDRCLIRDVALSSGRYVIQVRGEYPSASPVSAVTELRLTVNQSDLSMVSRQELRNCHPRDSPDGPCD